MNIQYFHLSIQTVKKVNKIDEAVLDHYDVIETNGIVRHVPLDEDNIDYKAIQDWLKEDEINNKIEEAD